MKKFMGRLACFLLLASLIFSGLNAGDAISAATVTKSTKTYEIAVAFDNSGSMYQTQSWCRAKYAMEIFASMLNYKNGDVLKIFPMWPVTTDGSQPDSGGSYSAIEIKDISDIDKISNLYTPNASGTPYAPVNEAYQALKSSGANEKWLIVLTDGLFNCEDRDEREAEIELQPRLKALAFSDIKVQYLGIGSAEELKSDASKHFYAKMSTADSLKDDLVEICNTIFQRSVLPKKYINGNSLNLDISMKNVIVFAQGSGASVTGLKSANSSAVSKSSDSGQRKFSTIAAGGKYKNAPVDPTLAGQVVTFSNCPKGVYTLEATGAEAIQIFYEPDVDIKATVINSDGQEVDITTGEMLPGDYTITYGIVDAQTGEDVTKAELMGSDVQLTSKLKRSDGTETEFRSGDKVSFVPDEATSIIIEGRYLKDYTISTEDDPEFFPDIKVNSGKLKLKATTEQDGEWYRLSEHDDWKPILLKLELDGKPLTDAQLAAVKLDLKFSKDITYSYKMLPGESAYAVYIGCDENGKYIEPREGSYKLEAIATLAYESGQPETAKDSFKFNVHKFGAWWPWIKWLLILAAILGILWFVLTRKAWPKSMTFVTNEDQSLIFINPDGTTSSLLGSVYDGYDTLACTLEKTSKLYQSGTKSATVRVISVEPTFRVRSFSINGSRIYTRTGDRYLDSRGNEFESVLIVNNSRIKLEIEKRPTIEGVILIND